MKKKISFKIILLFVSFIIICTMLFVILAEGQMAKAIYDIREPLHPTPINKYTISYETYGGTTYEDVLSSTIVFPNSEPEKEGYVFAGWFLDTEFSTQAIENDAINESKTIYAKWNEYLPITVGGITFDTPIRSDYKDLYLSNGTYYLYEDVSLDKDLYVQNGSEIKLCLNDHVLSFVNSHILDYGDLSIYDSGETLRYFKQNNKYKVISYSTTNNGEKIVTKGGVILNGCIDLQHANVVFNNGNLVGEGFALYSESTATFNNGTIQGCYRHNYGAVIIGNDDCVFTMNNGKICYNYATNSGAGILNRGTFNMFGGSITNNYIVGEIELNTNASAVGGGAGVISFSYMNVGGNAVVADNYNYELNQTDNVSILGEWGYNGYTYITVDNEHPFTSTASIGININYEANLDGFDFDSLTEQLVFPITECTVTDIEHFKTDTDAFYIDKKTNSYDNTKGECISLVHRLIKNPKSNNDYQFEIDEKYLTCTYQ